MMNIRNASSSSSSGISGHQRIRELHAEAEHIQRKILQADAGLIEQKEILVTAERMDWMYANPAKAKETEDEAFLLGKSISTADEREEMKKRLGVGQTVPGSLFLASATNKNEDTLRRLREDPLLLIRQAEHQQHRIDKERKRLVLKSTSPVADEKRINRKKRSKKRRKGSSDSSIESQKQTVRENSNNGRSKRQRRRMSSESVETGEHLIRSNREASKDEDTDYCSDRKLGESTYRTQNSINRINNQDTRINRLSAAGEAEALLHSKSSLINFNSSNRSDSQSSMRRRNSRRSRTSRSGSRGVYGKLEIKESKFGFEGLKGKREKNKSEGHRGSEEDYERIEARDNKRNYIGEIIGDRDNRRSCIDEKIDDRYNRRDHIDDRTDDRNNKKYRMDERVDNRGDRRDYIGGRIDDRNNRIDCTDNRIGDRYNRRDQTDDSLHDRYNRRDYIRDRRADGYNKRGHTDYRINDRYNRIDHIDDRIDDRYNRRDHILDRIDERNNKGDRIDERIDKRDGRRYLRNNRVDDRDDRKNDRHNRRDHICDRIDDENSQNYVSNENEPENSLKYKNSNLNRDENSQNKTTVEPAEVVNIKSCVILKGPVLPREWKDKLKSTTASVNGAGSTDSLIEENAADKVDSDDDGDSSDSDLGPPNSMETLIEERRMEKNSIPLLKQRRLVSATHMCPTVPSSGPTVSAVSAAETITEIWNGGKNRTTISEDNKEETCDGERMNNRKSKKSQREEFQQERENEESNKNSNNVDDSEDVFNLCRSELMKNDEDNNNRILKQMMKDGDEHERVKDERIALIDKLEEMKEKQNKEKINPRFINAIKKTSYIEESSNLADRIKRYSARKMQKQRVEDDYDYDRKPEQ